jgi:hypothetical protein
MSVKYNKLGMPLDPDGEGCPGCPAGKEGFCDWIGDYHECTRYQIEKLVPLLAIFLRELMEGDGGGTLRSV